MGFYQEDPREKVPFFSHPIKDACHQHDLAVLMLALTMGLRLCLVFHCKGTPSSCYPLFFGITSLSSAHT